MQAEISCPEYKNIKGCTDEKLLAECAQGKRFALEEFFTRFNGRIARAIKKTLFDNGSDHLASSDAFHEVSSRVIDKLLDKNIFSECRNPANPSYWLESISRNESISWLREKGLLKNLPKQPIDEPAASINQPIAGTIGATLGEMLPGPGAKAAGEPEKQCSSDDVLAALSKIPDERNRWVCRLWALELAPLSKQEMRDLAGYAGIALEDVQGRVAQMMENLARKKADQDRDDIISLRLWHRLRKLENELYDQFCRPSAVREQELQSEITKLSDRYEKKRKIVTAHIRPSNSDITFCVGIPKGKAAQISNIFARNRRIFSPLIRGKIGRSREDI